MIEVIKIEEGTPNERGVKLRYLYYRCPGCETGWHQVVLRDPCPGAGKPSWLWNEDTERPTLSPSILQFSGRSDGSQGETRVTVCHHFVRDGKIEYLSDCPHPMKGMIVDMVPWEAPWEEGEKT
jgi:hypothetical protein